MDYKLMTLVVGHFSAVSGNATKVANYEPINISVTVHSMGIGLYGQLSECEKWLMMHSN